MWVSFGLVVGNNMSSNNKRKSDLDLREGKNSKYKKQSVQSRSICDSNFRDKIEKNSTPTSDSLPTLAYDKFELPTKLNNLIRDLDELLNTDNSKIIQNYIGEKSFSHCLELQASLKQSTKKSYTNKSECPEESQATLHEISRLPKLVSPFSLSPWKSSSIPVKYPPLPEILNPVLEAATFIHCSAGAGHKGALNYEQLELIGDAYMELIATLLISLTFPCLSPGKQSQIREMLIKNITLASYSLQYNFDKRLKMDVGLLQSNSLTKVKVLGDVFEAYVAAVILSDPLNGIERASNWLKSLWSMTISTKIIQEEKSNQNASSHLWQPQSNLSPEKIAEAFNKRPVTLNAKEQLQKLIGGKHAKLSYREVTPPVKDPDTKLAVFFIGVYLDGWGENNKLLGKGQANGKKEAGLIAAAEALKNEKLIKKFADQKTAQRELEIKNS